MKLPVFQIDAFARGLFTGNPAAVVLLQRWIKPETMQLVAAENNLAETAFVLIKSDPFEIRWFTPKVEVDLCGHATLASAAALLQHGYANGDEVRFSSTSGALRVLQRNHDLALDFPARPGIPIDPDPQLNDALGAEPTQLLRARDTLAVFETEVQIETLRPNFARLSQTDHFGVIATAPGESCDFVSRFFAPKVGIDEDPATGSAHCTLIPYWSERLSKRELSALQISSRVGTFSCTNLGERVLIGGQAVEYLRGEIEV